ncbi:type III-B CRISPR module RAMP protein Cmr1 [Deinococcus murrayi]|uniref:type III-B CRISPR module RAMP protein Cmr1 n=1 Tax=Deinococcus murrayi TaxID=68910 RepID=UPI00048576E0|nr:type III-B CRISPR module RAMP protein Cmr1 [Deinococcus murrayi]
MPRTPPPLPADLPDLSPPETLTVQLRTLTPMFGGGAETREVDDRQPVRAASVRGGLRFWWRATAGAGYATAKELHDAESALWGNTETPGRVRVEVEVTERGTRVYPSELNKGGGSPAQTGPREAYFVHPFQEIRSENKPETFGLRDVAFTVTLTLHRLSAAEREQVVTAVRAWIAFGGVGARTRRGCGALTVAGDAAQWLPAQPADLWAWFGREERAVPQPQHSVLAGAKALLSPVGADPVKDVWRDLGRFWARFRKGHYTERRPDYSPMSGGAWRDHRTLQAGLRRDEPARLAKPFLGLPIVYQKFPRTDAFAGTIEGAQEGKKRMASPVILKPCAFRDGVRGLVLVLNAPPPRQVKVSGQPHPLEIPPHDPVLASLGVRGPLAAVRAAAKIDGYPQEVSL